MESAPKVTDYIAIYAAVLSTLVFLWNVLSARPKITVTLVLGANRLDEDFQSGVGLNIQNPSPHTVHVTSVSILYPFRRVTLLR